jgi:hypothetical protein
MITKLPITTGRDPSQAVALDMNLVSFLVIRSPGEDAS